VKPEIGNKQKDAGKRQGISVLAQGCGAKVVGDYNGHQKRGQPRGSLTAEDCRAVHPQPAWGYLGKYGHMDVRLPSALQYREFLFF
jgi:hypothetical protein